MLSVVEASTIKEETTAMMAYFVYMMTNYQRTVLYTGITNSLVRRVTQHRGAEASGFTERYNVNTLVYYEQFNDVRDAIAREKQIKGWSRAKKEKLIDAMNPERADLAVTVLGLEEAPIAHWHDPRDRFGIDPSASSG
jgi:putative endonuclease